MPHLDAKVGAPQHNNADSTHGYFHECGKKRTSLYLAVLAISLAYPLEHTLLGYGLAGVGFAFTAIFAVILAAAFSVAHHAEALAHKYGEPYGTLILTGSAVGVEVIMLVILMQSTNNPALVMDTIYAALMLDINGILVSPRSSAVSSTASSNTMWTAPTPTFP